MERLCGQDLLRLASLTSYTDEALIAFDTLAEPRFQPVFARPSARRYRPVARRQDRVHHRPRPQPHPWRPSAALRGPEVGAHRRAPGSSRSPTTTCRASITRTMSPPSSTRRTWPNSTRAASASCGSPSTIESASGWNRCSRRGRLQPRYRRLSRRMAARSAAARQDPTRSGRREALRRVATAADRGRPVERVACRARRRSIPTAGADEDDGARGLPRPSPLSQRLRARRTRALDAAAGPVPDARRSRRLARADLCAARHRSAIAGARPGSLQR